MRNTTSALAPLQTEEREAFSVQQQRNQKQRGSADREEGPDEAGHQEA